MKTQIEICRNCGKKCRIENRTHMLCSDCNQARKGTHKSFLGITTVEEIDSESNRHTTSVFASVRNAKTKPTGEALLFDTIWKTRPHISFISGKPINIEYHSNLWYNCFFHVLAKGKYPAFRLLDKNIVLGLPDEHTLYDQGTEGQRRKYAEQCENDGGGCDWEKLYSLREELKSEYK